MKLTEITMPFGMLQQLHPDVAKELQDHGGPYEAWSVNCWMKCPNPSWLGHFVYRVAQPEPLTKPYVDWSHVAEDIVAMATNEDGATWMHSNIPPMIHDGWSLKYVVTRARTFASFRPGTCDWRDSLVIRPTKEN